MREAIATIFYGFRQRARRYILTTFFALLSTIAMGASPLMAAPVLSRGHVILDAETTWILRQFLGPIYRVAGIQQEPPQIFVLIDPDMNAFAVPGPAIFVHTGLIFAADTVGELIGVLAHETGHIGSNHISRRIMAYENAATAGYLMGGAGLLAGVLGGSPDLAIAGFRGGMDAAQRSALHFTRGQESSADQAAVRYLDRLQWSAGGLRDFFIKFKNQENLPAFRQLKYLVTHPLSAERMRSLDHTLENSPFVARNYPQAFDEYFQRLKAKAFAYTMPIAEVDRRYPLSDVSLPARYAQAIVRYRQGNLSQALGMVDELIAAHPKDPFFHEFKGILLFEQNKIPQAVQAYEQAIRLFPNEPLFYLALAQIYLQASRAEASPASDSATSNQKKSSSGNEAKVRGYLKKAIGLEPSPMAWHYLAILEGQQGNVGRAALALSEKALLENRLKDAKIQATRATTLLKSEEEGFQRARDILVALPELEKEDR